MTVSFWFNVADADKAASDRFLGTGAGDNTEEGWTFFMRDNAAGTIGDGVDTGMTDGGGRRIQGTNANDTIDSLDGNWHLLVGVFDHNSGNGTASIYLDSVLESTIALADLGSWDGSSIDNTFPLTFGKNPAGSSNYLDGYLDDVAIWDTALSQSQIYALWNGGAGQPAAELSGATSQLVITPNATTAGHYDFSWDSQAGKLYDLVSETNLATTPDAWPVWQGNADIASGGTTTILPDIPGGGDSTRFFAVVEKDPPPLLEEDFDEAGPGLPAGWVAPNATNTVWDVGDRHELRRHQCRCGRLRGRSRHGDLDLASGSHPCRGRHLELPPIHRQRHGDRRRRGDPVARRHR